MPALTIRLPHDAAAALRDLAQVECRTPRDRAAFLVIQGLRGPIPSQMMSAGPRRRQGRPASSTTSAAAASEAEA